MSSGVPADADPVEPREDGEVPRSHDRPASRAGFLERAFVEEFNALIEEGAGEHALDLLVENLPAIAASKLNRKEKLNHLLFTSLILQDHAGGKHGYRKLLRKVLSVDEHVRRLKIPADSAFLDFGCGAHDPIAMGLYYYLNGFSRAIACDLQQPRNPVYSALSMYAILANIAIFPERYVRPESDRQVFDDRFREIPTDEFAAGGFDTALDKLAGRVDLRIESLLDLDIDDEELGLVVSFAVMEHVEDIGAVMEWLFRKSRRGGVQYHFIDMADHRSYVPGGRYDAWSFLAEHDAPKSMNRLRKTQFLRAIEDAGFEILASRGTTGDIPAATSRRLLPQWRNMSEEDQRTIKLSVTLRRPE